MKKISKKPMVTAAAVISAVYLLAVSLLYSIRGNSLTIYEQWPAERAVPAVEQAEQTGSAEITDVSRYGEKYISITVEGVKPGYTDLYVRSDEDTDILVFLEISEHLSVRELGSGNYANASGIIILTILWLWGITAVFAFALRKHLKYSIFSYNISLYSGFGIMFFMISLLFTIRMIPGLIHPEQLSVYQFHSFLGTAGITYVTLMFPVIFLLTVGLVVSNIALWRREGRGFTNTVGTILGIAMTVGSLLMINMSTFTDSNASTARIQMAALNGAGAVFLYLECMWVGSIIAALIAAGKKADCDREYLIILGCSIRTDGTPTPLLKGRCDAALRFDQRQRKQTGRKAMFVVSGGQGSDEVISEADSMKNYLLSRGINMSRILLENRSTTTYENFRFSKILIGKEDAKIAFFTTKYHVFRSGIWARRAGFQRDCVQGEGASTKWYFWPNAFVREFAGLISSHRLKQILILFATAAVQVVLTLLFFLQ